MSAEVDPREERIALVADSRLGELVLALGANGFGVIQLPPAALDEETAREWLQQTAEQVAEYLRNGYEVCAIRDGIWDEDFAAALASFAVAPLPDCCRGAHMSYTEW